MAHIVYNEHFFFTDGMGERDMCLDHMVVYAVKNKNY